MLAKERLSGAYCLLAVLDCTDSQSWLGLVLVRKAGSTLSSVICER